MDGLQDDDEEEKKDVINERNGDGEAETIEMLIKEQIELKAHEKVKLTKIFDMKDEDKDVVPDIKKFNLSVEEEAENIDKAIFRIEGLLQTRVQSDDM